MRAALLIGAILSAQLGACAEEPSPTASNEAAAPPAATAPAALPSGAEGVRRYAECAATLNAVSTLYSAIASQSSGAEAEEMRRTSSARSLAAFDYETHAQALTRDVPNLAADEVTRLMSARRDRLEQERERQPFEDFVVWLGREADQCAAIAPRAG